LEADPFFERRPHKGLKLGIHTDVKMLCALKQLATGAGADIISSNLSIEVQKRILNSSFTIDILYCYHMNVQYKKYVSKLYKLTWRMAQQSSGAACSCGGGAVVLPICHVLLVPLCDGWVEFKATSNTDC
jgi:hypothetical protein